MARWRDGGDAEPFLELTLPEMKDLVRLTVALTATRDIAAARFRR
jgi:hypothetical protein